MKTGFHILVVLVMIAILVSACAAEQPVVNPGTVPSSLQTIEAAAEDIIDFASSGNWDKINADLTDIEQAWMSYQSQADNDGASQEIRDAMISALADLKTASASKGASATLQGSNDISAAVVELFALYNPKVPADIGRLDVLERQVILDLTAKDYAAAEASLARAKSVWEQVKPSVSEHNGKNVTAEFDASLATQESALNATDDTALRSEASNALEIVDEMEQLY